MTTLNVTLSRAHKITERLRDLHSHAVAAAVQLCGTVSFSAPPMPSEREDLARRPALLQEQMARALELAKTLGELRAKIAVENSARGIDARLTEHAALKSTLALCKMYAQASDAAGCLISEIDSRVAPSTEYYSLTVNPLKETSLVEASRKILADTQMRMTALADEIAELNSGRVTFTLPDHIAVEVTGVAA